MSIKKAAAVGAAAVGMVAIGTGTAMASADAEGVTANSPGVLSGNSYQAPFHFAYNNCGNTTNLGQGLNLLNPAFGNSCANIG